MAPSDFLKSFLQGIPGKNIRLIAARGFAPIPPDEMLELLVHLTQDSDSEVATQAHQTLRALSEEEMLAQVRSRNCSARVMEYVAATSESIPVLEAIILNPSTPGNIIESLASTVTGPLLEAILYNRVRLIGSPGILEKVKLNPALTPEVQRLVQEIELEFFSGKKKEYATAPPTALEIEPPESPSLELEMPREDLSLEGLPVDTEERQTALTERFARMAVRLKMHHALMGSREARAILIRDPNKEVARNVLHSPKLSESEVETFSGMRNVSDEILREIGNSREWARNYTIMQNLVRNPKTPPLISQRMLSRLQTKDLANLVRDRSVPEAVRRNAQRTLSQRLAQRTTM